MHNTILLKIKTLFGFPKIVEPKERYEFVENADYLLHKFMEQTPSGVKAIADYLGCDYQRVHNWIRRGIPAKVKVENPNLFLTKNPKKLKTPSGN